jgi:hypothetical protein
MKLEDILLNHHKNDIYPWHMPGHKRNTDFINLRNPYVLDITEITALIICMRLKAFWPKAWKS